MVFFCLAKLHNILYHVIFIFTGETYDYKPETSVPIDHRKRFSIRTMQDRILEYNETFMIEIDQRLHREGDCSCITKVTVTIVDDDCKFTHYTTCMLTHFKNNL